MTKTIWKMLYAHIADSATANADFSNDIYGYLIWFGVRASNMLKNSTRTHVGYECFHM